MVDISDLIRRAKEGVIENREVDLVAELVTKGARPSDLYRLLYIIARSDSRRYEGLVASFLEYRDDTTVVRLALQTLCTFWGLTWRYADHVHRFIEGVEWDYIGDVREVAITAAGRFLRGNQSYQLLLDLLRVSKEDNEDPLERRIAVEALAEALGDPRKDVINADKGSMPWETWASDVRRRGEIRLATEGG